MMIDPPMIRPRPTRIALVLRAVGLVVLGLVFSQLLVLNPHDNAYLTPWIAGRALFVLAAPFAIAALLPAGEPRRIGAWVAVSLVWGLGGLLAALFLYYAALIVGSSLVAHQVPRGGVAAVHVIGTVLLVATVFGVNRRLFRA